MTSTELAEYIEELATAEHDYNSICDGCVDVMLKARKVFTDKAQYGISGVQASMIGHKVASLMS